jgi:hypothetical protein
MKMQRTYDSSKYAHSESIPSLGGGAFALSSQQLIICIMYAPHEGALHAITLRAISAINSGCASWKIRQTLCARL